MATADSQHTAITTRKDISFSLSGELQFVGVYPWGIAAVKDSFPNGKVVASHSRLELQIRMVYWGLLLQVFSHWAGPPPEGRRNGFNSLSFGHSTATVVHCIAPGKCRWMVPVVAERGRRNELCNSR
jgi:hypothetical protein